jgi:hypothetical protein
VALVVVEVVGTPILPVVKMELLALLIKDSLGVTDLPQLVVLVAVAVLVVLVLMLWLQIMVVLVVLAFLHLSQVRQ